MPGATRLTEVTRGQEVTAATSRSGVRAASHRAAASIVATIPPCSAGQVSPNPASAAVKTRSVATRMPVMAITQR